MDLLRDIIDWKIYKKDEMTGVKVTFFRLFRFTVLRYYNGPKFIGTSNRRIFNYEFGIGIVPRNFMEMIHPSKVAIHFCKRCGPFVRGYSEIWEKGVSEPYEIQFFQYENGIKQVVEKIKLKSCKSNSDKITMNYCGICNLTMETDMISENAFRSLQKGIMP